MNTLRIGAIIICALATLAGSFALRRNATSEIMRRQEPTAPAAVATLDGAVDTVMANDRPVQRGHGGRGRWLLSMHNFAGCVAFQRE